jgi:phosphoserine phosphatase
MPAVWTLSLVAPSSSSSECLPEPSLYDLAQVWLESMHEAHGTSQWKPLHPTHAGDLYFETDLNRTELALLAEGFFAAHALDWALFAPNTERFKPLLLADMDSTLVQGECIDELGALMGVQANIAAITQRAMEGDLDFESALKERLSLLKGMKRQEVESLIPRIKLSEGADVLCRTLASKGAYLALVSGGFSLFTQAILQRLGMHFEKANILLWDETHCFTGEVLPPILGKEAKVETLNQLCQTQGLHPEEACCVGDGANDLGMILACGLGVAYQAKPKVRQAAPYRIQYTDLSTLLYWMGIPSSEWCRSS